MSVKSWLYKSLWLNSDYTQGQMTCPEMTFSDISPALYKNLLDQASTAGVEFNGSMAHLSGIDFQWRYDGPSQTLSITTVKKPFYVSCDQIRDHLASLISKAKTQGDL